MSAATRSSRAARSAVGVRGQSVSVEGVAGGRDRLLDLAVGRDVDLGDDGRVGRVDDRAALAAGGGDPLAVDEEAGHGLPRARDAGSR